MSGSVVRSGTTDMTTGGVVGHIVRFAIPMLIGNLFQQLYNLVDSVIVGRYVGAEALAAVGATGSVTFLFFALCNGIGSGGGIVASQKFGYGNKVAVRKTIANTAYVMTVMSVVVGGLAYALTEPLLGFLDTPGSIMADSVSYMHMNCLGLLFVALYNYASSMLRALGDSRTPLYFLVFSCLVNVFLDIFFVYNLSMGVFGAALATVIAQFISGVACLGFAVRTNEYFKLSREDLAPDKEITIATVRLGLPLSLQFSLIAISCMALQRVVNGYGPVAVAAFTATSRVEQVIHQPYQTLGASLSTFSGQNFGAGRYKRVVEGLKKGMIMMIVFSVFMLPLMQFAGRDIVGIFVEDKDVIEMGARALQISSYFYFALGTIYVSRGILTGVGDGVFALQNGIVEVIGRLIFPIAFTMIPALGVWGIWWSTAATWVISGGTALIRYRNYGRRIGLTER